MAKKLLCLCPNLTFVVVDDIQEALNFARTQHLCAFDRVVYQKVDADLDLPSVDEVQIDLLSGQYDDAYVWYPSLGEWYPEPRGHEAGPYRTDRQRAIDNRQVRPPAAVESHRFIKLLVRSAKTWKSQHEQTQRENAELKQHLRDQTNRANNRHDHWQQEVQKNVELTRKLKDLRQSMGGPPAPAPGGPVRPPVDAEDARQMIAAHRQAEADVMTEFKPTADDAYLNVLILLGCLDPTRTYSAVELASIFLDPDVLSKIS